MMTHYTSNRDLKTFKWEMVAFGSKGAVASSVSMTPKDPRVSLEPSESQGHREELGSERR